MPAHLIKIKYITIRVEKVASPLLLCNIMLRPLPSARITYAGHYQNSVSSWAIGEGPSPSWVPSNVTACGNLIGTRSIDIVLFYELMCWLIVIYWYNRQGLVISPPGGVAIRVSVGLSVCLSARISQKPHTESSLDFLYMLPVAVARQYDMYLLCYVLPVLWPTSLFT